MATMDGMLTTTEAARLTDPPVSRFTVEREIARGNLEAAKHGGRWFITEAEARRWSAAYRPFAEQRDRKRGE